jgi:perosamine synthetase
MGAILDLARKHHLPVIEDACEAIGAEYRGRRIGGFGNLGVFSFYPNKPITTGEGGVVVTNDPAIARTIRALRNQGRMENDGWLEHSLLGYNYRLPDINCALGISQLSRIESMLARREAVAKLYHEILKDHADVTLPPIAAPNGRISWFAFVVRLAKRIRRDRVIEGLTAKGIGCRPYFPPIHLQPLYSRYVNPDHDLAVTEQIAYRTLALPFFNSLKAEEVEQVCGVLKRAIQASLDRCNI